MVGLFSHAQSHWSHILNNQCAQVTELVSILQCRTCADSVLTAVSLDPPHDRLSSGWGGGGGRDVISEAVGAVGIRIKTASASYRSISRLPRQTLCPQTAALGDGSCLIDGQSHSCHWHLVPGGASHGVSFRRSVSDVAGYLRGICRLECSRCRVQPTLTATIACDPGR